MKVYGWLELKKFVLKKSDCVLILLSSEDDDREAEGSQPQRRVNWSPQLVNTSGSDRPFSSTSGIGFYNLENCGPYQRRFNHLSLIAGST